jgi:hypothetical protein
LYLFLNKKNHHFYKFPADSHQLSNAKNGCKVAILMCVLGVDGGGASVSGEVVVLVVVVGGGGVVVGYWWVAKWWWRGW